MTLLESDLLAAIKALLESSQAMTCGSGFTADDIERYYKSVEWAKRVIIRADKTHKLKRRDNMTKAEFVAAVAEELDVPKTVAAESVDAFISVTTKLLKVGDKITFPSFGTFGVAERAARKGRNPQTGAEIQIAASKSGKFTAGKDLKGL